MNKQAITFLSLFSLILVLSVYYILLPPINNTDLQVSVISDEENQVVALQVSLDQERIEIIQQNNNIIASSSSDPSVIEVALQTIADTKELIDQEKKINTILNNAGYEHVFCEITGNNIKVVIEKNDTNATDANAVIKLLINEFDSFYQVEVKFVEA